MKREHSTEHQVCSAGFVARVTLAKFGLQARNMNYGTQNEK
jgi:hypothetical protein